jgi:hypothetical protein
MGINPTDLEFIDNMSFILMKMKMRNLRQKEVDIVVSDLCRNKETVNQYCCSRDGLLTAASLVNDDRQSKRAVSLESPSRPSSYLSVEQ